jgi:hypothetical protein
MSVSSSDESVVSDEQEVIVGGSETGSESTAGTDPGIFAVYPDPERFPNVIFPMELQAFISLLQTANGGVSVTHVS